MRNVNACDWIFLECALAVKDSTLANYTYNFIHILCSTNPLRISNSRRSYGNVYLHMQLYIRAKMIWLYHVIVDYDFALLLLPSSRFQRSHRARFSVNAEIVEPLSYIIHESSLARETNLYAVRRSETISEETALEETGGSEFPFVNINWFPYRTDCESDESASTFFFPSEFSVRCKVCFWFSILVVDLNSYNVYISSPSSLLSLIYFMSANKILALILISSMRRDQILIERADAEWIGRIILRSKGRKRRFPHRRWIIVEIETIT